MHPDETLDGYTLLRRIGAGGYGEVWLCRSRALGDLRAFKFIASASQGALDREFKALTNYRNAAARLRSPHLMPIEHVGRAPEGLFYVMPLADGNLADPLDPDWSPLTLGTVIARRKEAPAWFSCEEISGWMRPVLEALQILSDAGFAHRDVKPDNILFCGGRPILGDISLLDEDHADLTRCGTPGYSAPSWYQGGHPDLYGAAATLYTLLTGNLPDRMGRSAFNGPPQGDGSLTAEERIHRKRLHAVVRRATQERVSERYPDFQAMAAALAGAPTAPPSRTPPVRAGIATVALLLGAASFFFFQPFPGGSRPEPPENVLPSAERIQADLGRGDFASALAGLELLFSRDPKAQADPDYSTARAMALQGLGRTWEAREELRREIPRSPEISDVTTRQHLWEQLGDLSGAETDLTRILETSGPDALLLSMRAGLRARQGDFKGVHADWEAARKIRPADPGHLRSVDALWSPIKKLHPAYMDYLRSKGEELPPLQWIWSLADEPWVFDSFLEEPASSPRWNPVAESGFFDPFAQEPAFSPRDQAARTILCHDLDLAFRTGDNRKALTLLDRILYAKPGTGNAPELSLLRALLLRRLDRGPEMEAELGRPCHRELGWDRIDARIYLWDQLQRWEDAEHFLTSMLEYPPDSAEDPDLRKLKLLKYRATVRARLGQFDAVSVDRSLAMESFGLQAERRAEVEQIWDTLAQEFPAYAEHLRASPEKK
ncbi:MAG: hypothetical protein KGS60_15340 [Verrucomicrobia bacterium]|nr:hypothetical protein [Verrucomicrobiota bacterium]